MDHLAFEVEIGSAFTAQPEDFEVIVADVAWDVVALVELMDGSATHTEVCRQDA